MRLKDAPSPLADQPQSLPTSRHKSRRISGRTDSSGGGKQAAALWVNGKLQRLSDGSLMTWATGLAVR